MPIAFLCHYCGRRIEVPRSQAGQSTPCACGVTVTVPGQTANAPPKPIVFGCPHCKKRFKVDADSAGKKIMCPCGVRVVVPKPKAPSQAKEAKPRVTGTVSFNCNHCRKRHTVPADLAGQRGRCTCGLSYVVPKPSAAKAEARAAAADKADKAAKAAKAAEQPEKPKTPNSKPPGEQVVFNCPRCKRSISLPATQIGRNAKCTCSARFVVPAQDGRPVDLNGATSARKT